MLKWAVTPRPNGEYFPQDNVQNGGGAGGTDDGEFLTLQTIIQQHRLPCLVRLINDDLNESNDNYCLLLGQTNEPYLLVSNETERFSVPISFDGKSMFVSLSDSRLHAILKLDTFSSSAFRR